MRQRLWFTRGGDRLHNWRQPQSHLQPDCQLGYIQMPDMNTMYMWSYALAGGSLPTPRPSPVRQPGRYGDGHLAESNPQLPECTGANFDHLPRAGECSWQMALLPSPTWRITRSPTALLPGGSITYSFVANRPGTFIYESGTDTKMQVSHGFVRRVDRAPTMGADYVYNRADSQFTPTKSFLALLSEIDPYQHQAVEGNRVFNMNNYRARYWLINGRGFPDSIADNYASWLPSQPYGALARIYPYDATTHPYPAWSASSMWAPRNIPSTRMANNGLVIGRDGYPLEGRRSGSFHGEVRRSTSDPARPGM